MERCSFCKIEIKPGRGITYVETSGRIFHYCSSKCRRNMALGRDANRLKWITKRQ